MADRWRGLVPLVARLRREVERAPRDLALRERAAWVGFASLYGTTDSAEIARRIDRDDADTAFALQSRINLSTLAILSRGAPDTWLCRPSASAIVHDTDLHSIPTEPPRLLRAPGIVEVRRPETGERLWGDYASLGWYEVEGATFLLGLSYPDGYAVARWTPAWTGQDLDPQLPGAELGSPLIDNLGRHHDFAVAAARYLVVLGLLAEAEDSPLRIELDRQERRTRHVYLGDRPALPRDAASSPSAELPGRVAEQRLVSGHLKRQRYGEGRALTKWIYVEAYAARRWFASRWVVSAPEDPPGPPRSTPITAARGSMRR